MRQYFYLVCINYDECTFPKKIFLQEDEAITWGRREATKNATDPEGNPMYEYVMYKQEISRTGMLTGGKTLYPYKAKKGADFDIDSPIERRRHFFHKEEDIFG